MLVGFAQVHAAAWEFVITDGGGKDHQKFTSTTDDGTHGGSANRFVVYIDSFGSMDFGQNFHNAIVS
jgi:hypothetical protein